MPKITFGIVLPTRGVLFSGAANRVLTRAQLTELLRGRDADPFDRSIDVRVSRLRQILGDDARAPQIIKTVYGEGYVVGVNVVTD
jgi:two-component system OmpR family response regulator